MNDVRNKRCRAYTHEYVMALLFYEQILQWEGLWMNHARMYMSHVACMHESCRSYGHRYIYIHIHSVLQCVAVCCSVLQCVVVSHVAHMNIDIYIFAYTVCCSVLQCVAVCCSVLCRAHEHRCVMALLFIEQLLQRGGLRMSHVAHVKDSCRTCERSMLYIWMNESCCAYEWVMWRVWMSHVAHMKDSCCTYEWMSHVARKNESCRTYEGFMLHMWMDRSCCE